MENTLDEDYINELGKLKIGPDGSGFLSVNQEKWQEELYRLERTVNLGCVALFVITFILMFFPIPGRLQILITATVGGIFYKRLQAVRYKNLINHGLYQYEIYDDRIVRYSSTWFRKFHQTEISLIKQKKFGILIVRKKQVWNFYLNHANPEIIVIPNKIQGYKHLLEHLIKEKESG